MGTLNLEAHGHVWFQRIDETILCQRMLFCDVVLSLHSTTTTTVAQFLFLATNKEQS